jgi:hypothetical protein
LMRGWKVKREVRLTHEHGSWFVRSCAVKSRNLSPSSYI